MNTLGDLRNNNLLVRLRVLDLNFVGTDNLYDRAINCAGFRRCNGLAWWAFARVLCVYLVQQIVHILVCPEYIVLHDRVNTCGSIHLVDVSSPGPNSQSRSNSHTGSASHNISRQIVVERRTKFLGPGKTDWPYTHRMSLTGVCKYDCQNIFVVKI